MDKKLLKRVLLSLIIGIFLVGGSIFAQDIGLGNTLDIVADSAGVQTNVTDPTLPDTIIGAIITWVLGFIGVLFLSFIIFAGYQWMTAGGNEEKVDKSKKRIISSVIGLALVFFAFIISNLIFEFFYEQTNKQYDQGPEYGEGQMISCENNSDCPIDQPVCTESGIWKFCSCNNNSDCIGVPGKPICGEIALRINRCVECANDNNCAEGEYCDLTTYTCEEE